MPDTSQPKPAGYSGKPLGVKLGIKTGSRIVILNAPARYLVDTLVNLPNDVNMAETLTEPVDLIQFFCHESAQLAAEFPALKAQLKPDGALWISWPKRAAKLKTDLSDEVVRTIGLAAGLVDVKVAAVDEVWSGLKFVYRLTDRTG